MEDILVGISPQPSTKVSAATSGLYDSVVVGVYSQSPNVDAKFFRHTVISSLMSLGWDQQNPHQGVLVRFIGDRESVLRMVGLVQDIPLSKSTAQLHYAPLSAEHYQQLDYEFKHLTHLITFHSQNQPLNLNIRDMAKSYCLGVLDVVCDW